MKRKRSMVLKAPSPRNPFVAVALFKKAGAHRKFEKALRRQEKVHTGSVAQMDESNRLLPGRCEFDARQVHHKDASQSEALWNAVCPVTQQVGALVQEARFLCVRGSPMAQKKQLPQ